LWILRQGTCEFIMDTTLAHIDTIWQQSVEIWLSGGWAMIAIATIAVVMFGLGVHVKLRLSGKGFTSVREKTWRRWIDYPEERKGPVGALLDFVTGAATLKDSTIFFEELRATEISPFERDLRVMKICVSAAPLMGLLGTVTGMLATFAALASGAIPTFPNLGTLQSLSGASRNRVQPGSLQKIKKSGYGSLVGVSF